VDANQVLIKVILIVILSALGLIILLPGRGARGQAIRRLTLLVVMVFAIVAVVFPSTTNEVAALLGVGRGADLLLYGLIVVFLGYAVTSTAHARRADRQITELARRLALADAESPPAPEASAQPDATETP
jgi:hypothetical protein